ncbi:MAG TPA: hypothetical protein VF533_18290 [Solirubrobacteraceae bacterium]|jgi:hypothetical protein
MIWKPFARWRRVTFGVLAVAGASLVLAPAAAAGTYVVKACADNPQTDGWAAEPGPFVAAYGACPAPGAEGGLVARLIGHPNQPAPGFAEGKTFFTSPAGTNVVRLQAFIRVEQQHGWQAGVRDFANGAWLYCGALRGCTTFGTFQPMDLGGLATSRIGLLTICAASECRRDANYGYAALKTVTLTIDDYVAPDVRLAGGTLLGGGWRRGTQTVDIEAGDSTGIKDVRLLVDGATRDADTRTCDVFRASPCPNGGRRAELNTAVLQDGRHTIMAQVRDAGDNVSEASREVLVDNTPPGQPIDLALDGGDAWRPVNRYRVSWRNPREAGVAPIAAAEYQLCPAGTPAGSADCRRGERTGRAITSIDDFTVPFAGDWTIRPGVDEVELRVRAATAMRVNRSRVANGETVLFRGRLRGGHLPPNGKLVALQVYSRGKWRTFATPRASSRTGRWRYEYRFDGTRGSVRYKFRTKVLREAGYPFSTGKSRKVRVTVHGASR